MKTYQKADTSFLFSDCLNTLSGKTMVININPVLFSLGPLEVRWYGLMYVVAIVIGLLVAWPYAKSKGITMTQMENIVIWAVPAGLIGARLYYVLQQPLGPYLEQPWRIIAVWEGGMAFYGAIFAVVATVIITAWRQKVNIPAMLDVAVLFAVVGQFFGRIGNIINGDVLGYPTTLPWGFTYIHPDSFAPSHDVAYHPAAVYEAIINIILFSIMFSLRKKFASGILFFIYILLYSICQVVVFFWRDNEVLFWGLKQAQLTAIGVIAAGLVGLIVFLTYRRRHVSSV
jgi:phosphatidylglycerol:prolipoprotein diacylglycerol transferase